MGGHGAQIGTYSITIIIPNNQLVVPDIYVEFNGVEMGEISVATEAIQ